MIDNRNDMYYLTFYLSITIGINIYIWKNLLTLNFNYFKSLLTIWVIILLCTHNVVIHITSQVDKNLKKKRKKFRNRYNNKLDINTCCK